MANITRLNGGGGSAELTGNASTNDVLKGKTFYSNDGEKKLTGLMTDNGAWNSNISPGDSITIPYGFHNGTGVATALAQANQKMLQALGFTNVPAGIWVIKEGELDINVVNDNPNIIPLEVYVAFSKLPYNNYHQLMYGNKLLNCGEESMHGDAHCFCGTDLRKEWISSTGNRTCHVKYWLEKVGG